MASGPNVQGNLNESERLIQRAVEAGAELVLLPENFAQMSTDADKLKAAEAEGHGPIQEFLAETAKRFNIWLAGGSIPLRANRVDHVRSSLLLYNNQGEVVARYDKMHLFDVTLPQHDESYHESVIIEPGDQIVVADTPYGKVGLSICYDIRFPELYRQQLDLGMEVSLIPSAFTAVTGKAHWQALLQARAIENQCYVIAADQGGYHVNGRETYGHSMIIDPWGTILDCLPSGAGFVIADIDRIKLEATRANFPAVAHRRLSCHLKEQ
ncbi:MAG: carbon-nitrogen hydrolase family protein [Gammaproteobacteria bacterium]|nr:carbon-nitrogen hydrolase family protein [Gammaproteobacteria bacterium]